jgi:shikimate kinase/nitroreductase
LTIVQGPEPVASTEPNVVLVGFMATGKSSVARALAERLGRPFVDTDAEIEARHGPIPAIFDTHGEAGFRAREREVAADVAARRGLVVSTGGGMVVDPANAAALAATGRIFCLTAEPDEILRRVLADPAAVERPLLRSDDPAARVRALLEDRASAYRAFAQIPTDGVSPDEIAEIIIASLPTPPASTTSEALTPMTESRSSDARLLSPFFVQRTSTRSFTERAVTDDELAAVFEAARWSPSWFNNQPWIFVYETDGADRQAFLDVIVEGNRWWAQTAPVVGLILARTELEGFMARSRDFDVGAATMAMTIQATMLGLSVHLMGGIDLDAAYALTGADPATTEIICGFVIGHKGDGSELPEQYQAREVPSGRKPVAAFVHRGAGMPSD